MDELDEGFEIVDVGDKFDVDIDDINADTGVFDGTGDGFNVGPPFTSAADAEIFTVDDEAFSLETDDTATIDFSQPVEPDITLLDTEDMT